jgi:hypothetical protein
MRTVDTLVGVGTTAGEAVAAGLVAVGAAVVAVGAGGTVVAVGGTAVGAAVVAVGAGGTAVGAGLVAVGAAVAVGWGVAVGVAPHDTAMMEKTSTRRTTTRAG